MEKESEIFSRATLLLGDETMAILRDKRVIVFGVGGVGSWCAECLIRTGVGHLTMVDFDKVSVSNVNRQLMATVDTVGQVKVDVLRQRLLSINPQADVVALQETFTEETSSQFDLDSYDYVIDVIDSLRDKARLILQACQSQARLFSSMGAALKMDPSRIGVAEFWQVKGDPLARALRNYFKRQQCFPRRKFKCVFSDEMLQNNKVEESEGKTANGSLVHITAIFGCTLASLVIRDVVKRS